MATLLLALCVGPASAHLTTNSEVQLATGHDAIRADIIVPQGEYAYATGNPVGNDAHSLVMARGYLLRHAAIVAPGGRPWTRRMEQIVFAQIAGPPDLHPVEQWTPPPGAPLQRLSIRWRVIVDALPNHFALFLVGSDVATRVATVHEVIGAVQAHSEPLVVGGSGPVAQHLVQGFVDQDVTI